MDPITTGIIASATYDILKNGLKLRAQILKEHLGQWLKEDIVAEAVAEELRKIDINDEMSETAISRRLERSPGIIRLIDDINVQSEAFAPSAINNVQQTHSGSGDNVAGNKIVK